MPTLGPIGMRVTVSVPEDMEPGEQYRILREAAARLGEVATEFMVAFTAKYPRAQVDIGGRKS